MMGFLSRPCARRISGRRREVTALANLNTTEGKHEGRTVRLPAPAGLATLGVWRNAPFVCWSIRDRRLVDRRRSRIHPVSAQGITTRQTGGNRKDCPRALPFGRITTRAVLRFDKMAKHSCCASIRRTVANTC